MKKGINKYLGAFVMGTALMAVPSCTDTWNEHYQPEDEYTATETLWELLESREDLSRFCNIAAKAKFYRDETHPAFTLDGNDTVFYTFKDVLSANTPVTVWAPRNDAMDDEEWQKYEDMAQNDGYNLQQQFVGNHMALYRKTMVKTGTETFRLINSKFATIDYADKMFQKAKVAQSDIPARNGLLHILESRNEFLYNLYEYIKFSGEVPTFHDYLVARDTTYFLESSSIEGLPDENGNPTYVDSVYFQDNMMFNSRKYNPTGEDANDAWMNSLKMFMSRINMEDSAYVVVIPTDEAWANATERMKQYYNYGEGVYPRMSKVKVSATKAMTRDIYGARKSFPNGKGYETVDSLQTTNIDMDIIWPLSFNINLQPQQDGLPWTKENFMNGGYKKCEYLLTTVGDTIRDIYEEIDGVKTLVWRKDDLFEKGKIEQMSNGYAIISDKWNYHRTSWMRDIDVDVSLSNIYDYGTSTRCNSYDINNTTAASWIDQYGRCSEQRYMNISGITTSTTPDVAFALQGYKQEEADVMSAKYDVQVVLVPMWYNTSAEEPDLPETEAGFTKARLICTLYGWSPANIGGNDLSYKKQTNLGSATIEYSGEKVDTITVLENVEFPLSYKNLNDAFPVLNITSAKLTTAELREGYSRSFNIDRIILKCKEEIE